MEVAVDNLDVNIPLFDISHITPGFSYHYPPALVYIRNTYTSVKSANIFTTLLASLSFKTFDVMTASVHALFEECYKMYFMRYVDTYSEEPGDGDVHKAFRAYMLGGRILAYCPNDGVKRKTVHCT